MAFDFYRLFPNPAVLDALGLLLANPDRQFYQKEVAQAIGCTGLQVQRALGRIQDAGLVDVSRTGQHVFYQANQKHPAFEGLRLALQQTIGLASSMREALFGLGKGIDLAFVFGSVAKGSDGSASDVDVLLVGDVTLRRVAEALGPLSRQYHREINPVVMPLEEFRTKARAKNTFVTRVLTEPKLWLRGDSLELERLVA